MSDSVRPHRREPTRLRHPWDSPGKNPGVGCHFLFQNISLRSYFSILLCLSSEMGLLDSSIYNFLRNYQTVFCSSCTILHAFPQFSTFLSTLVQFSSVAQSCPTLCDPMNLSMPGLPVHHHLPEITQTHVHRVRMSSSHLILGRPLLLLPLIPPNISHFQ